ncbi:uncharacterized protein [Rutidosis leptorrhynchoides]|uniref:uncharacterized protein n=1 Tax=Rutidosis leptorrhynchoides TaxID=125765 RepID=UPI003A990309
MQVDVDDWIICGDFNEVRRESERKNCVFVESRAKMFNDFIDKSNLVEIPLGGMKFTRISDDGLKYSKLDRFLVSKACITRWVGIVACTLDRKHSDHCPIILKVCANDFGPRPTRVFNNCFEDVECEELIKDEWKLATRNPRADCIVRDKLKRTKLVINKNLIQNTTLSTSRLRTCKKSLWVEDSETIKLEAFKHFQERFRDTNAIRFKIRDPLEKCLTSEEENHIETPFTLVEIFNAITNYGGDKAPGPYSINWDFLFEIMKLMGFGS